MHGPVSAEENARLCLLVFGCVDGWVGRCAVDVLEGGALDRHVVKLLR